VSGFAAIFNADGAPVDTALLERMKSRLAARGPDQQAVRVLGPSGNVGLVHALLRTTNDNQSERQPCTLDGKVWIAGHIRVDAREDLWPRLEQAGCAAVRGATDAELVLHAYRVWGEECVGHLLGDYSWVLWDGAEQKLFGARDHLGVRPLFYARIGAAWVVSNSLECAGSHPGVSRELEDLWVADFLLFGHSKEFDNTVYKAIRRLPPAHSLTIQAGGEARLKRYWSFEIGEPVYRRRPEDYCEQFRQLLSTAVKDRLRTSRVGVYLSGGLDSSTLAATAAKAVADPSRQVLGYTFTFHELIPDDEEPYVRLTASRFGFPVLIRNRDHACYDPDWWRTPPATPEPDVSAYCRKGDLEFAEEMARESRVWFYGEGPDNALRFEWQPYLRWLAGNRRWGRMIRDVGSLFWLDSPASILEDAWRRFRQGDRTVRTERPAFPEWIAEDLADRLELQERWNNHWTPPRHEHPWHPWTFASFTGTLWQHLFERFEPENANPRFPSETRHPYLDLRMLRFLVSVPVAPWGRRKLLTRLAMRGTLPAAVLKRQKTALRGDPWQAAMRRHPFPALEPPRAAARYIDLPRLPTAWPSSAADTTQCTYALAFLHWLRFR